MKREISIQIIRIIAMLMIISCHIFSSIDNTYTIALSQLLSVGVYIFLYISGYLYYGKKIGDYKKWYLKKITYILVPFWLFTSIVLLYLHITTHTIKFEHILIYAFNMQGFFTGINGLGHLWFLTPLMICYLLLRLFKKAAKPTFICLLLLMLAILFTPISSIISHYLFYLLTFALGYYSKKHYHTGNPNKHLKLLMPTILISGIALRIIAKKLIDGTIIYDSICTPISSILICCSLFYIIYNITRNNMGNPLINLFDRLSYYIYITHYVFIVGPFWILNQYNIMISIPIILVLSLISSVILYKIHSIIIKKIYPDKRKGRA